MLASVWTVAALCSAVLAFPTMPPAAAPPGQVSIISDYFNLIASKVAIASNTADAPVCDMSKAVMPVASPTPLPAVSEGLRLKHVAIGRGIQNYTCDLSNSTAVPAALGAVATLYNASCVASTYPDVLALLPNTSLQFSSSENKHDNLYPTNLLVSGHHFFANASQPIFNLNTPSMELGEAFAKKNNSVVAPTGASAGVNGEGNGAVTWLKLTTLEGTTGNLQEVYRVNTAGGNPPLACTGMPAAFEIQYAAEYWFYEN